MRRTLLDLARYSSRCRCSYRAGANREITRAFELNEIELCYFAALIHGLRLINEKAAEKHVDLPQVDADALVQYVQTKGDRLVALHFPHQEAELAAEQAESNAAAAKRELAALRSHTADFFFAVSERVED